MDRYEYKYNKYKHKYLILKKGGKDINKFLEILKLNQSNNSNNKLNLSFDNNLNYVNNYISFDTFSKEDYFKIDNNSYKSSFHPYGIYTGINKWLNLINENYIEENDEKILYLYFKISYDNDLLDDKSIVDIENNNNILSYKSDTLINIHIKNSKNIYDLLIKKTKNNNNNNYKLLYKNLIYLENNLNEFNKIFKKNKIDYVKDILNKILDKEILNDFNKIINIDDYCSDDKCKNIENLILIMNNIYNVNKDRYFKNKILYIYFKICYKLDFLKDEEITITVKNKNIKIKYIELHKKLIYNFFIDKEVDKFNNKFDFYLNNCEYSKGRINEFNTLLVYHSMEIMKIIDNIKNRTSLNKYIYNDIEYKYYNYAVEFKNMCNNKDHGIYQKYNTFINSENYKDILNDYTDYPEFIKYIIYNYKESFEINHSINIENELFLRNKKIVNEYEEYLKNNNIDIYKENTFDIFFNFIKNNDNYVFKKIIDYYNTLYNLI